MPKNERDTSKLWVELTLVLLSAAFIYGLVFKLPDLPFFMSEDHLIFLYVSGRMLQGDVMYVDFFQFTFPGTQVLYFFLLLIFGAKYWILPAVICLIGVTTFWLCLRVSRLIISGPLAYLPPITFIFFGFRLYGIDGSHRMISPIFILLAIYILVRGRSLAHIALAGASC